MVFNWPQAIKLTDYESFLRERTLSMIGGGNEQADQRSFETFSLFLSLVFNAFEDRVGGIA